METRRYLFNSICNSQLTSSQFDESFYTTLVKSACFSKVTTSSGHGLQHADYASSIAGIEFILQFSLTGYKRMIQLRVNKWLFLHSYYSLLIDDWGPDFFSIRNMSAIRCKCEMAAPLLANQRQEWKWKSDMSGVEFRSTIHVSYGATINNWSKPPAISGPQLCHDHPLKGSN